MATNPDRSSHFPAIEKKYGQTMSYWFDQMDQIADRKYPEQIAFLNANHDFSQAHANALVMYCRGSHSARAATERLQAQEDVQVPVDWKPDATLLRDMAAARIAEIRG